MWSAWPRATVFASLLFVAGCVTPTKSVYDAADVGRVIDTSEATVVASRVVTVKEDPKGYGPLGGAAVGATGAGLTIGRGSGSGIAALVGGLIGAGVGYAAEQAARNREGIEYVIRTPDGRTTTLVQNRESAETPIAPGTQVLVQHAGTYTRVIEKPEGADEWKNPDAPAGQGGAVGSTGSRQPTPPPPPSWRYGGTGDQTPRGVPSHQGTVRPVQ
jgi:outer membrane lipoprotein SlyB